MDDRRMVDPSPFHGDIQNLSQGANIAVYRDN